MSSTSATFWALMTSVVSSSRPLTELLVRWRGGHRHVVAELDTVVVRRDLNDHGVELGNDMVSAQCYPMSSRRPARSTPDELPGETTKAVHVGAFAFKVLAAPFEGRL